MAGTMSGPGKVFSSREHSSCQTSVSSKPAMSGPESTRISVSSTAHPVPDVVLGPFAQSVLTGADASQPAQSPAARFGVSAAVDDLEPNAVAGVQGHTEAFGHLGQLWRNDEVVGTRLSGTLQRVPPDPSPGQPVFRYLEAPRRPSEPELRLLSWLGAAVGQGLADQVGDVAVIGECTCGCSSVRLSTSATPIPVETVIQVSDTGRDD
jgi:hypothetical protein